MIEPSMEDIKRAVASPDVIYTSAYWRACVCILLANIARDSELAAAKLIARPLDAYHEDQGPVLWWKFPIDEPPYCGSPLDTDWPGYHTHWTPIDVPMEIPQ